MKKRLVLAASLGNCVHVAGAIHFLELAADEGYETLFLGPAVKPEFLLTQVAALKPEIVSVGYRLTPENVEPLLDTLISGSRALKKQPRWVFGGTRPVAERAARRNFFDKVFFGTEDIDETLAFLRGNSLHSKEDPCADNLLSRIAAKSPYPLLRHHFGLPDFSATESGIAEIAASGVLDVISLGPDQNTQQYFFHPDQRDPAMDGAGGVPIKTAEEFRRLKAASRQGNFPLMRCYSGTADVFRFAQLLCDTIQNAWCAVPLCWYNELDGRGSRSLEESITQAQQLMAWHAARGIPVEVNEPHHWGLRDAHDVISVVMAYLAAYNAKRAGVRDYIAQYMFNVPGSMSFAMDLAKGLAMREMVESLADETFRPLRQVRAGLPFLSGDLSVAKGQLAASTYSSMALAPQIVHVVGYSEAERAADPSVVIESCRIVRGVVRSILYGGTDPTRDPLVQQRKSRLLEEARFLLSFIRESYSGEEDPLSSAEVLADCIRRGILDAPHILKNEKYHGILETRMVAGSCLAWDTREKRPISESERIERLERAGNLDGLGEMLCSTTHRSHQEGSLA